MLSAATLGEAVRLASDFDLLTFTHFRVSLLLESQDACLRLLPQDDIPNDLRTLYEDRELAAVIAGGEQALGLRLQPSQISMMHGVQNTAHYEAFFQCPVQFSQAHAEFRFDAALALDKGGDVQTAYSNNPFKLNILNEIPHCDNGLIEGQVTTLTTHSAILDEFYNKESTHVLKS